MYGRCLHAANLMICVARKTLLTIGNRHRHFAFTKLHKNWTKENWEKVLWTEEVLFRNVRQCEKKPYVHKRIGEKLDCQARGRQDPSMELRCFNANGVGHIHHTKGITDEKVKRQMLIHHMLQLGGKDTIILHQYNDLKHSTEGEAKGPTFLLRIHKNVKDYIKCTQYLTLQN